MATTADGHVICAVVISGFERFMISVWRAVITTESVPLLLLLPLCLCDNVSSTQWRTLCVLGGVCMGLPNTVESTLLLSFHFNLARLLVANGSLTQERTWSRVKGGVCMGVNALYIPFCWGRKGWGAIATPPLSFSCLLKSGCPFCMLSVQTPEAQVVKCGMCMVWAALQAAIY